MISTQSNELKLLRKCPICECMEGELLCTQIFTLFEDDTFPKEYRVVSCLCCGMVFHDSKIEESDYEYYYNKLSKYDDEKTMRGGGTHHTIGRLNQTAEYLSIMIRKDANILDIGCANGVLLELLREREFKHLSGMDMATKSVENTRKRGFEAFYGSLSSSKFNKKFDLIIVSHVVEHVFNLKIAMSNIFKWLLKGGQVYVEVPDGTRYYENFLAPFSYFSLEHINHFGKVSLTNLLNLNGFDFVAYRSNSYEMGKPFPIQSILGQKVEKQFYVKDISFDYELKNNILKYISISKEKRDFNCLDKYTESNEPVVLWGAGQYTQQLLADSKLKNCN